jgi:ATP-dependent helicase/DNAse subunit B
MAVHLYLAPAASGKTAYLVERARAAAHDLEAMPRVIVPTRLQVRAWQRRLAERGGALGVRVSTFDALSLDILSAAGEIYARLTEPIQYRLLRTLAGTLPLAHYAPLQATPGFVQIALDLIRELKAGGVYPEAFAEAVAQMGGEPRLVELVLLYSAYQQRLQEEKWADPAGIGWLAAEVLARRSALGQEWPLLLVDGFDDLTTVQIRVLEALSSRVGELLITLTGTTAGRPRTLLHKRFLRTRARLEERLGIQAEPLPGPAGPERRAPALAHLEPTLFGAKTSPEPAAGAVSLVAAPDREGEVRTALRWLKARLVCDGLRLHEIALLARSVEPYRDLIYQVAAEFGLPVHVVDGLPLRSNPAVAALLDLLRLAQPVEEAFPWRATVESWRSPYLNWSAARTLDTGMPIGIAPEDAVTLDRVARWASVIGGLAQWEETFALLIAADPTDILHEEGPVPPTDLPTGEQAQVLRDKFARFVQRITPPQGAQVCRVFVAWLEGLIGSEEEPRDGRPTDLGIVRRVWAGPKDLIERDLAALNALKDVLRGLVWADEAVGCTPLAPQPSPANRSPGAASDRTERYGTNNAPASFADFYSDLAGAIQAATYRLPLPVDQERILVATVAQARGVPLRAAAVLGLAEGEFPTTLAEDPFLRDADRRRLRDEYGLDLDLSTDSAEAEFFYEAITRPRETLLLTRPRIADNGAPWQPSPFWEEVQRRVVVTPQNLTSASWPTPSEAASWSELLLGVSGRPEHDALWKWARQQEPARTAALEHRAAIVRQRAQGSETAGSHDGNLTPWATAFSRRYGSRHVWSASRLETYRTCPFWFLVGSAMKLEPRTPPTEGLDGRQLGNLYHRILEQLYQAVEDPTSLDQLLEALPRVAAPILDEAPRREQFRPTHWWERTRAEIVEYLHRSLEALAVLQEDWVPIAYEAAFGFGQAAGPPLEVRSGDDIFRLHGLIDRVDRDTAGRVRIVDYKTAGPWSYGNTALVEGKKLQLPLYARGAQDALGLGEVVDGFYWHVQHAEASAMTLRKFKDPETGRTGPAAAIERATAHAWEAVRGVRSGRFVPHPPEEGCPDYCPAAAFCWRYERKAVP